MQTSSDALARLDTVFGDLRDQPFSYDWHGGLLRIGHASFALPMRWLGADPSGDRIVAIVQQAWREVLDRPLATFHEDGVLCLRAWNFVLRYEPGAAHAWPAWIRSGRRPRSRDSLNDGQALAEFPGVRGEDVGMMLTQAFNGALVRIAVQMNLQLSIAPDFGNAVADSLLVDIAEKICEDELDEAIALLVAGSRERSELLKMLSLDRMLARGWLTTFINSDVDLSTWPARDINLRAFLPAALCSGASATPDGVLGWLRANGLSRTSVVRLRHVPESAVHMLVRQWLWHATPDFAGCVAWLNTWLSELHAKHDAVLRADNWQHSAELAGLAGALAAYRRDGAAVQQLPRPFWHWPDFMTGRQLPDHAVRREDNTGTNNLLLIALADNPLETHFSHHDSVAAHHLALFKHIFNEYVAVPETTRLFDRHTLLVLRKFLSHDGDMHALIDPMNFARDWVVATRREISADDLGNDWETLQRRQRRWHNLLPRRQAARQAAELDVRWEEPVRMFAHDMYVVVPLDNARLLTAEGETMHHCVGTYTGACANGTCRIFSVRELDGRDAEGNPRPGAAIGTAEFSNLGNAWRLVQFRGYCNENFIRGEKPLRRFRPVMEALAKLVNDK